MAITLDELLNCLPPERRKAVEERAAKLILAVCKKTNSKKVQIPSKPRAKRLS